MRIIILITVITQLVTMVFGGTLKTQTYHGSEAGFLANSHLIESEKEMILVDAQFTAKGIS